MYVGNLSVLVLCALSAVALSSVCRGEEVKESKKVLRHAVFFKFKDEASAEDVAKVVAAFDALPRRIDSIKAYERGENFGPRSFGDGFTHCFLLTFKDEAGRATYLPHPEHKAFGTTLGPHLDKVFVVDYWGTPEKQKEDRRLKHALFLRFKQGAAAEEVKALEEAFAKLPSQCETIKAFEWGKNNSPEKHYEDFTHCFMFTFDDEDGLKAYASAPAHSAVAGQLRSVTDKARVFDYWTKEK
jgi:hypothetical protein